MNLHEALKVVKERVETGTVESYRGICAVLDGLEFDTFVPTADQLSPLFERWPKYSGSEIHPVPSPDSARTSAEMFYYAQDMDALWEGEYGACAKSCWTS